MKRAIIVCNGTISDYSYCKKHFLSSDYVICADGGAKHLKILNIKPDVLLGDFDSISIPDMEFYEASGVEILKFPVQKDMTDSELAITLAVEKGFKSVVLIGATGDRYDHSLSNIFMLKNLLDKGVTGQIINEKNDITLINKSIKLIREENIRVSLIPLSEVVEGVTTKGLFYPLKDVNLNMGTTWGVSNEFVDDEAEVTIKSGLMLVIKSRD